MQGATNVAGRRERAIMRQNQALALRIAGRTFAEIATVCGYTDRSAARKAVDAALLAERKEHADGAAALREVQRLRIETMLKALWPRVVSGDVHSIGQATRLLEREARLFGLDAPTRITVTDEMTSEIESLLAEMADAERRAALEEAGR